MLISMRWLARHVDLEGITPEALCDELTLSTAEVEGLARFAPALSDVVVGRVEGCSAHPDATKLTLCRVDVGDGGPLSIVCGAPNVAQGQKVAVARVGIRCLAGARPEVGLEQGASGVTHGNHAQER